MPAPPPRGRLRILGPVPTPRPRFLPQPPAVPDGFVQPLLRRPGACFPPGRADLEPSAAHSPAPCSPPQPLRCHRPSPSPTPFRLREILNFPFPRLAEVKTWESGIRDLQEAPGSIRWGCQGVRQHLGRSTSSGITVPIPLSPFAPVTDRWDVSPCQGCFSSAAAATWKPCRTCLPGMCRQGIPKPSPSPAARARCAGGVMGGWSRVPHRPAGLGFGGWDGNW